MIHWLEATHWFHFKLKHTHIHPPNIIKQARTFSKDEAFGAAGGVFCAASFTCNFSDGWFRSSFMIFLLFWSSNRDLFMFSSLFHYRAILKKTHKCAGSAAKEVEGRRRMRGRSPDHNDFRCEIQQPESVRDLWALKQKSRTLSSTVSEVRPRTRVKIQESAR